ncbi:uncharacterized protein LOC125873557 [Solanum stenotomum]|uniref:uncharacterized protein LOC125873557 n=1 Tax=Solanum stenotomum TaxID=172797 RepID=UPI0020D0B8FB|nr:uncharacterized protein LOC125873557 [Solanum stenotomum]
MSAGADVLESIEDPFDCIFRSSASVQDIHHPDTFSSPPRRRNYNQKRSQRRNRMRHKENMDNSNNTFLMKKLRRLPHVFNYFLELPFRSDADVAVEEKQGFFYFMAKIKQEGAGDGQVRAQAVEIHPGVTKIVVRKGNGDGDEDEQLNVDTWRYRLPASTMPELATAVFVDGNLIVAVPKDDHGRGEFDNGSRGVWRDADQLVLVQ